MSPHPMPPTEQSARLREMAAAAPVVPVLVIAPGVDARALGAALVSGGLPMLEVTLRTPAALEAIAAMADLPGAIPGAGTLLTPADVRAARQAGARFGVSPGATPDLLAAAEAEGLPLLPGAATASEVMALLARGHDAMKLFPAAAAGGTALLKSLAGPLPQAGFCPTGGIGPENAAEYLRLPNVMCVGGSWVAPPDLLARGDWAGVEALARAAAALPR
ncbi:bifunctional 4-hydroxy-2-oxoglutarate aldolase/2-dehydro-3-deoxy-phosphogluconate aldolase [Phaeovulum vinaykumarii]|uniref:2-dehydro-3-deoxy-phosphogluconate aldolase n=1 Tax=Phaeovulum vinaykumarii TaxID=407234 RepID=A0A1N7M3W7_9RHOB|nr:bifunctional 4-hydroxy-2-oxoglutarate aldolase/2-dehydro-3-deoxy-phosphogluconate aldolase [Phaeovulum vinaykumarii]SIS80800.1 2-keto-3-deoxy-phosphogluconate aldolase [Phaeovulum vinaykumarii]SOC08939.1 2-dehydro-3-deoxyphosphogluconate aldolase/(4S)-4-hydroxy-2-oxoglutarate aldolase [Phaeovulum vinaykumarii]